MHCLEMDTLLLCIRCCEMCLPVCYLAMHVHLLLDARWLERVYLFVSYKQPNLSQYVKMDGSRIQTLYDIKCNCDRVHILNKTE
jgi:hypothetical protein